MIYNTFIITFNHDKSTTTYRTKLNLFLIWLLSKEGIIIGTLQQFRSRKWWWQRRGGCCWWWWWWWSSMYTLFSYRPQQGSLTQWSTWCWLIWLDCCCTYMYICICNGWKEEEEEGCACFYECHSWKWLCICHWVIELYAIDTVAIYVELMDDN